MPPSLFHRLESGLLKLSVMSTKQIKTIVRRNFRPATLVAFLLAFCLSCDKDKTEPVNVYNYFPLEIGRYQIYDVKEEIYSSGQKDPVVKSYQEKDEIERTSTNVQGTTTYIFSRSTRNTSTEYWQKVKEFSVQAYPDKILTTIDNQTFFSLVFPIDSKVTWNGNAYNNLDAEDYRYEGINEAAKIGQLDFSKILTVLERKDTSIIDRYVGIKKYALEVGLVSDDQTAYQYCQNDDCIGTETIESGFHKVRTISEHGQR